MDFGQIVAPTIKELFIERIEGMIFSGTLKPGDRLPSERDLAEQMKISKTIVHLGLEDLARMGFIEVTPRRGTVVADFAETGNLETLNAILRYNGGKLDRQMVVSIVELRSAIAVSYTHLSAGRMTAKAEDFCLAEHAVLERMAGRAVYMADAFAAGRYPLNTASVTGIQAKQLPSYAGSAQQAAEDAGQYLDNGFGVLVLAGDMRRANILTEMLQKAGVRATAAENIGRLPGPGQCSVTSGGLSAGMEYPTCLLYTSPRAPAPGRPVKTARRSWSPRAPRRSFLRS